ncbi:MAG: hypothetical protein FWG11_07295, partial [Promicromonosporaceae bacterium]|nr:hypothetical protein [Promicromonosporaceae bacterium]
MSPRHLSARARAAAVLACLLGLGVAFGGHLPTAVADPSGASSDDELAAAQAAEHEQARLISEAEGRLAGLRSELALAEEQVDTAAEDYTEALWRLETAELAHAEAEEAAAEAGEQAIVVRNNLVEAFRAIWREGEVGSLEVITGATDLRDVARRADLNRAVARRLGSLLGETISTRSAAAAARERWAAAGELEEAAAGLALITLEQAYSAQQELEELQAGAEVERAELIGRLAELRQTTVEIEEQREAEREEAARLAEEQRLRDEAEPPAAPSAPGGPPSLAPSLPPGPAPSPPPGGEAPPTDPPSPPASPTPAPSPTPSPPPSPSPAPPPVAGAPASSAEQGLAALAFAPARLGGPHPWGGTGN